MSLHQKRAKCWFLPLLALASGCFNPTYPENLPCDDDGWCPPGQVCNLVRACVAGSADGSVGEDSQSGDATPADASGLGALLSISIGEDITIVVTGQHQFTCTAIYEYGELEVTEAIIWRSENTAVVGVDFNGLATGVSAGETEVTARWQGRADGAIVTVTP